MEVTTFTNGLGIACGVAAVASGDEIAGTVGAICAGICAAGYIIKIAAKIGKWIVALVHKMRNGATECDIMQHFDALEDIGKEIENHGKNDAE